MNIRPFLDRFFEAVAKRNSALANDFQPGLAPERIQAALNRMKVTGNTKPLVEFFSWRNGTKLRRDVTLEQISPFPKSAYALEEFEMLSAHFKGFEELIRFSPNFKGVVSRYFPLFWDNSASWISVDLEPASQSRIVLFDPECGGKPQILYATIAEFFEDAIRANLECEKLKCFDI